MKKSIHNKLAALLEKEQNRIEREIEIFEHKLRDTMSYYGIGGPYSRQEAALDYRRKERQQIEHLKKQLEGSCRIEEEQFYSVTCGECGNVLLSKGITDEQYFECPSCRYMIHRSRAENKTIKIAKGV